MRQELVIHFGAEGWGYPACGASRGTYVVTDDPKIVNCVWCISEAEIVLPNGLCADRAEHESHMVVGGPLAPYRCTGDPADREPGRSERRRAKP